MYSSFSYYTGLRSYLLCLIVKLVRNDIVFQSIGNIFTIQINDFPWMDGYDGLLHILGDALMLFFIIVVIIHFSVTEQFVTCPEESIVTFLM